MILPTTYEPPMMYGERFLRMIFVPLARIVLGWGGMLAGFGLLYLGFRESNFLLSALGVLLILGSMTAIVKMR